MAAGLTHSEPKTGTPGGVPVLRVRRQAAIQIRASNAGSGARGSSLRPAPAAGADRRARRVPRPPREAGARRSPGTPRSCCPRTCCRSEPACVVPPGSAIRLDSGNQLEPRGCREWCRGVERLVDQQDLRASTAHVGGHTGGCAPEEARGVEPRVAPRENGACSCVAQLSCCHVSHAVGHDASVQMTARGRPRRGCRPQVRLRTCRPGSVSSHRDRGPSSRRRRPGMLQRDWA